VSGGRLTTTVSVTEFVSLTVLSGGCAALGTDVAADLLSGGDVTQGGRSVQDVLDRLTQHVTAENVKLVTELTNRVENVSNEVWPWVLLMMVLVAVAGVVTVVTLVFAMRLLRRWIVQHSYLEQKPEWVRREASGVLDDVDSSPPYGGAKRRTDEPSRSKPGFEGVMGDG